MRVTGIREFRDNVPDLVAGDEIVFVTRHGKLSGLLIPFKNPGDLPVELKRELIERLGTAISDQLAKRGVGEEKVLRDFESWKRKRRKGRG